VKSFPLIASMLWLAGVGHHGFFYQTLDHLSSESLSSSRCDATAAGGSLLAFELSSLWIFGRHYVYNQEQRRVFQGQIAVLLFGHELGSFQLYSGIKYA
jgi:hypothetical protein